MHQLIKLPQREDGNHRDQHQRALGAEEPEDSGDDGPEKEGAEDALAHREIDRAGPNGARGIRLFISRRI
ncbi:hypothetical protein D3C83_149480 [compost metagenome]